MTTKSTKTALCDQLAAEPFTLAMSSGFFGFYAHCGVLAALEEAHLTPIAVRGSSAGAMITGLWAAGLGALTIAKELTALKRQDFWDPRPGLGLLRGQLFDEHLRRMLPVADFAACRVPFRASVFDVLARRTVVVDSGDLAAAIRASCALPFMFQPVWIKGRPYLDGGILDRPGLHGHPDGAPTLYHHLLPTSPWRQKNGKSVQIPAHAALRPLVIAGLPKVDPWRMDRGREAFRLAREGALRQLEAST